MSRPARWALSPWTAQRTLLLSDGDHSPACSGWGAQSLAVATCRTTPCAGGGCGHYHLISPPSPMFWTQTQVSRYPASGLRIVCICTCCLARIS